MNYADRLEAAVAEKRNPCLVGLDPHIDKLPEEFAVARDANATPERRADAAADFLCEILDIVAPRVPAVKPQSAFFEVFGAPGIAAWERVVRRARELGVLVIGDVKRGDIGSTSAAYAAAFLGGFAGQDESALCDAVTINPYLGYEGVSPFLDACREHGTGVYVLVRTSNPGSARLQLHGDPPLCDLVARDVHEWGEATVGECGFSSIGAVIGATRPEEMVRLRELMPRTPFLLPGYGAQGAGASDIVSSFVDGHRGALVNSSRGILFAHQRPEFAELPWREAVERAIEDMIADITGALSG